jgi:hypothetical protein
VLNKFLFLNRGGIKTAAGKRFETKKAAPDGARLQNPF